MSKPKAFWFPGRAGDTLLQAPVAAQWLKDHNEQAEMWLDSGSCSKLADLFVAQSWVSKVELKGPSDTYTCGGQPWHGKFTTEEHVAYEIVPMGMRQFPARQITLQTALDCPLKVETARLATEPAFDVGPVEKANRVVLHGTFQSHMSGAPRFWRVLRDIRHDLEETFDEVVFCGTPDERGRARELYPGDTCGPSCVWADFDDHGSFLELARFFSGSRMVIGAGSSGAALGSVLKVPTLRIHDSIGEVAKSVWSGLGKNQWNETELELRAKWPAILEAVKNG